MIVEDVANVIRNAVDQIPHEFKFSEYPEIFKDDIYIANEMWKCPQLRKIHLETGHTKHLEVLHSVWYPDPRYNLPIFGCDIVANNKIVTAAIVDISPVSGTKDIYDKLKIVAEHYNDFDDRKLPDWADIFSPYCKFMRLHTEEERYNYIQLVTEYLIIYCDAVKTAEKGSLDDAYNRYQDQVYYCNKQRMNKKTSSVLSQWFDPEWAENYIDNVLFDKPEGLLTL